MDALLVIDMQIGCFAGDPPRLDQEGTVARINALAEKVRCEGFVVFVQHAVPEDGYAAGSEAWRLLPGLVTTEADRTIQKTACDAFLDTELEQILRAKCISRVLVVGCATDFCVDTTVRAAAAKGFEVLVPSDGHTTRDRPHLDAAEIIVHHNYMWSDLLLPRRRKVRVVPVSTIIAELSGPNQSLEPMGIAVTPRAAHVSRQPYPWLTIKR